MSNGTAGWGRKDKAHFDGLSFITVSDWKSITLVQN